MFDVSELSELSFVDTTRNNYSDYLVTAVNYDEKKTYFCENDHEDVSAAVLPHQSSFDPKTGDFSTAGTIVMVCRRCGKPAMTED